jgi:COMPASS component SWD3
MSKAPVATYPIPSPFTRYTIDNTLKGHKKAISSVNFSPDGDLLASSSNDRTVRIWDVVTGNYRHSLLGHQEGISDVNWSRNGSLLATGSDDTHVKLWKAESGQPIHTLKGHTNYVMCVGFHPEANIVASGSFDKTVRLWELRTGKCLYKLDAHSEMVVSANFNSTGERIVTAGFDGFVKIWDVKTGQLLKTFRGSSDENTPVCFAKWSPNDMFILVGSFDGTWKLLQAENGEPSRTYCGHKFNDYCLFASFSLNSGKWIISGSADNSICVWDITSSMLLQRLEGHEDVVVAVSGHPTAEVIASGSLDKTVKLWKPTKPEIQVQEDDSYDSDSYSDEIENYKDNENSADNSEAEDYR